MRVGVFLFVLLWAGVGLAQKVEPWPPTDPNDYVTRVDFTKAWAMGLRGFKTLADLQKAAGSNGRISSRPKTPDGEYGFHWRSQPLNTQRVGSSSVAGSLRNDQPTRTVRPPTPQPISRKILYVIRQVGAPPLQDEARVAGGRNAEGQELG